MFWVGINVEFAKNTTPLLCQVKIKYLKKESIQDKNVNGIKTLENLSSMGKFKLKRKILRFIASFTVFFRMNIIRDARVSLIQYKYQKLENLGSVYDGVDTDIDIMKKKLRNQEIVINLLINNLPPDKNKID